MKTKKLLLTLLMSIGAFAYAQAATVNICGYFINANSTTITVHISVTDGSTTHTSSVNTNTNIAFCDSVNVNDTVGMIDIWFVDCHGDTITLRGSYNSGRMSANFDDIDYCYTSTPSCAANFYVSQTHDRNTQSPVPFSLTVADNSTGLGLSYTWDFGDGNTGTGVNLAHVYTGNGPYNLCLIIDDGNGCRDTFCDSIAIDTNGMKLKKSGFELLIGNATTSVNEIENMVSVSLYPNPTSDYTVLEINSNIITEATISVLDVSGRKVTEDNMADITPGKQQIKLNVQNLPAGVYYVKVSTERGNITKKLLIE